MKESTNYNTNILLFASAIIPDLEKDESLHKEFISNFNSILFGLDQDSRNKIMLLLNVISYLSFVYNMKSFSSLTNFKRLSYINRLFEFPVSKIVSGLSGLRSLCLMSYYNIDVVMEKIDYDGPIN